MALLPKPLQEAIDRLNAGKQELKPSLERDNEKYKRQCAEKREKITKKRKRSSSSSSSSKSSSSKSSRHRHRRHRRSPSRGKKRRSRSSSRHRKRASSRKAKRRSRSRSRSRSRRSRSRKAKRSRSPSRKPPPSAPAAVARPAAAAASSVTPNSAAASRKPESKEAEKKPTPQSQSVADPSGSKDQKTSDLPPAKQFRDWTVETEKLKERVHRATELKNSSSSSSVEMLGKPAEKRAKNSPVRQTEKESSRPSDMVSKERRRDEQTKPTYEPGSSRKESPRTERQRATSERKYSPSRGARSDPKDPPPRRSDEPASRRRSPSYEERRPLARVVSLHDRDREERQRRQSPPSDRVHRHRSPHHSPPSIPHWSPYAAEDAEYYRHRHPALMLPWSSYRDSRAAAYEMNPTRYPAHRQEQARHASSRSPADKGRRSSPSAPQRRSREEKSPSPSRAVPKKKPASQIWPEGALPPPAEKPAPKRKEKERSKAAPEKRDDAQTTVVRRLKLRTDRGKPGQASGSVFRGSERLSRKAGECSEAAVTVDKEAELRKRLFAVVRRAMAPSTPKAPLAAAPDKELALREKLLQRCRKPTAEAPISSSELKAQAAPSDPAPSPGSREARHMEEEDAAPGASQLVHDESDGDGLPSQALSPGGAEDQPLENAPGESMEEAEAAMGVAPEEGDERIIADGEVRSSPIRGGSAEVEGDGQPTEEAQSSAAGPVLIDV
eukprot:RCo018009